jgi:glycosyltransferase involved in cell wall biosynthesis
VLTRYYQLADIALAPFSAVSTSAMPVKLYDYMAAGLPTICSLGSDTGQLLIDRDIGRPYVAEDATSLAGAIRELATNSSERERMARNAYDCASDFDVGVQYRRFAEFVEATA